MHETSDEVSGNAANAVIDLRHTDLPEKPPEGPNEFDTRARLVRAAAEVFREKGYTGSRVQDISRRAGFTSGALYGYFDSRAALLAEAIAVENDRLLREMSEGLGAMNAPVPAEIAAVLSQFVSLEFSPTDQLLLDGLAICAREPEARRRIGGALRRLSDQLEGRLEHAPARAGSPLARDPSSVSFLMVVFLAGATAVRAAGLQDTAPADLEGILAGLLGHLGALDGVDPRPPVPGDRVTDERTVTRQPDSP